MPIFNAIFYINTILSIAKVQGLHVLEFFKKK